MVTPEQLHAFAVTTILKAGEIAESYFRQELEVSSKQDIFDPVTVADKEVEDYIRKQIQAAYPDHSITGEEQDDIQGSSAYRWVIDPIDGTRSFITGMPLWGILLGLMYDGVPLLGIMYQPFTNEIYLGDAGSASLFHDDNQKQLSTGSSSSLEDAVIYTTHPMHFNDTQDLDAFYRLAEQCKLSRYGGDCYAYCLLASGHVDLVVETGLAPYDIIPLVPIIEGAGGMVTTWDGDSVLKGGKIIAASNRSIYDQAIAVLSKT